MLDWFKPYCEQYCPSSVYEYYYPTPETLGESIVRLGSEAFTYTMTYFNQQEPVEQTEQVEQFSPLTITLVSFTAVGLTALAVKTMLSESDSNDILLMEAINKGDLTTVKRLVETYPSLSLDAPINAAIVQNWRGIANFLINRNIDRKYIPSSILKDKPDLIAILNAPTLIKLIEDGARIDEEIFVALVKKNLSVAEELFEYYVDRWHFFQIPPDVTFNHRSLIHRLHGQRRDKSFFLFAKAFNLVDLQLSLLVMGSEGTETLTESDVYKLIQDEIDPDLHVSLVDYAIGKGWNDIVIKLCQIKYRGTQWAVEKCISANQFQLAEYLINELKIDVFIEAINKNDLTKVKNIVEMFPSVSLDKAIDDAIAQKKRGIANFLINQNIDRDHIPHGILQKNNKIVDILDEQTLIRLLDKGENIDEIFFKDLVKKNLALAKKLFKYYIDRWLFLQIPPDIIFDGKDIIQLLPKEKQDASTFLFAKTFNLVDLQLRLLVKDSDGSETLTEQDVCELVRGSFFPDFHPELLDYAIKKGWTKVVVKLCSDGYPRTENAIERCIKADQFQLAEHLINEFSAFPIFSEGVYGFALQAAIEKKNLLLVKMLVNTNQLRKLGSEDTSPLVRALEVFPEAAISLINAGADVNQQMSVLVYTNMHWPVWVNKPLWQVAMEKGLTDVVTAMIKKGLDLSRKNTDGRTLIAHAILHANVAVIAAILEKNETTHLKVAKIISNIDNLDHPLIQTLLSNEALYSRYEQLLCSKLPTSTKLELAQMFMQQNQLDKTENILASINESESNSPDYKSTMLAYAKALVAHLNEKAEGPQFEMQIEHLDKILHYLVLAGETQEAKKLMQLMVAVEGPKEIWLLFQQRSDQDESIQDTPIQNKSTHGECLENKSIQDASIQAEDLERETIKDELFTGIILSNIFHSPYVAIDYIKMQENINHHCRLTPEMVRCLFLWPSFYPSNHIPVTATQDVAFEYELIQYSLSPCSYALQLGRTEVVKAIIEQGVDLYAPMNMVMQSDNFADTSLYVIATDSLYNFIKNYPDQELFLWLCQRLLRKDPSFQLPSELDNIPAPLRFEKAKEIMDVPLHEEEWLKYIDNLTGSVNTEEEKGKEKISNDEKESSTLTDQVQSQSQPNEIATGYAFYLFNSIKETEVSPQDFREAKSQCAHIVLTDLEKIDGESEGEFTERKLNTAVEYLLEAKDVTLAKRFMMEKTYPKEAVAKFSKFSRIL